MEENMVYLKKFVVAIKVNGKVLREHGDTVYIPYGAEYSVVIKNLESVTAVASISIDGADVMDNREVIVRPNSTVELEGFIKGSEVTNKFKFIERTETISNFRGNKIDDGLIRVSFKFEKKVTPINYPYSTTWWGPQSGLYDNSPTNVYYGSSTFSNAVASSDSALKRCMCSLNSNDVGITVKGNKSDQTFVTGTTRALETEEHVIVLNLKGDCKTAKVVVPITVRTKLSCDTCGKMNRSNNKFCGSCGTALF